MDQHAQFCTLIGIPSNSVTSHQDLFAHKIDPRTLYARATRRRRDQIWAYGFTAALSNALLLLQVVLGATLTALGASQSSHVLITMFGVINTIVAGVVAYLKSRGQPMRARMFRDDLENVVEEIENSRTMWLGIRDGVHGYEDIDTDDKVSVRSEVARLTRLYESALKKYKENNPDLYGAGTGVLDPISGLRTKGAPAPQPAPASQAPAGDKSGESAPPAPPTVDDPDESPATSKSVGADKDKDTKKDEDKDKDKDKAAVGDTAAGPKDASSPPKDSPTSGGTDKAPDSSDITGSKTGDAATPTPTQDASGSGVGKTDGKAKDTSIGNLLGEARGEAKGIVGEAKKEIG